MPSEGKQEVEFSDSENGYDEREQNGTDDPDPRGKRRDKVNVVTRLRRGDLEVTQEPLPEMPPDLKELFADK